MPTNWKIKRDSYYHPLCEEFGEKFIETAGFLYDNYPNDVDFKGTSNIICTHIPKIDCENPVI
jgi:hypothetical protein